MLLFTKAAVSIDLCHRVNRDSTHVLVTEPGFYAWTQADRFVSYDGDTYKIVGRPDDVMFKEEVLVVPLELLS